MKHINLQSWAKRPFPFTTLLISILLIMTLAVGCTAAKQAAGLTPPPDFQLVAETDLSAQPYDQEILGEFTVTETAVTTIFYTLPNVNTPTFDLSLIGPDGSSLTILHSENYRTDENGGGTWEENLPSGTYRLVMTAEPGPGILSVYWKNQ